MLESRCEYRQASPPHWVKNCPRPPSDPYHTAPPERYPSPYRDRSTLYLLPHLLHQRHPCTLLRSCPAPAASDANALARQLPCKFTPIICANTGRTLIARS